MSTTIDALCGISSASPGATATTPRANLSKIVRRFSSRRLAETEQPVIPADAKVDSAVAANQPAAGAGQAPAKGRQIEPPIPTSVALVAPDTTPDAELPLDPSQVPQPAPSAPVAQPGEPAQPAGEADPNDVMRTLIGQHQANFKPNLISGPAEAMAAVSSQLSAENPGKAVVSATASAKAQQVLSEAQSGRPPAPHYNPNSLNRAIATTRMIFGDA